VSREISNRWLVQPGPCIDIYSVDDVVSGLVSIGRG
jgi:hypothetical protein